MRWCDLVCSIRSGRQREVRQLLLKRAHNTNRLTNETPALSRVHWLVGPMHCKTFHSLAVYGTLRHCVHERQCILAQVWALQTCVPCWVKTTRQVQKWPCCIMTIFDFLLRLELVSESGECIGSRFNFWLRSLCRRWSLLRVRRQLECWPLRICHLLLLLWTANPLIIRRVIMLMVLANRVALQLVILLGFVELPLLYWSSRCLAHSSSHYAHGSASFWNCFRHTLILISSLLLLLIKQLLNIDDTKVMRLDSLARRYDLHMFRHWRRCLPKLERISNDSWLLGYICNVHVSDALLFVVLTCTNIRNISFGPVHWCDLLMFIDPSSSIGLDINDSHKHLSVLLLSCCSEFRSGTFHAVPTEIGLLTELTVL
jgi:hypothetical protein